MKKHFHIRIIHPDKQKHNFPTHSIDINSIDLIYKAYSKLILH